MNPSQVKKIILKIIFMDKEVNLINV